MNGKVILYKAFLCNLIFLLLLVIGSSNYVWRGKIYDYVYERNISFSLARRIYNKYLGGSSVFSNIVSKKEEKVFGEKISYYSVIDYFDGGKVFVDSRYLVPNVTSGVVVYIGDKDRYGNVVIVEDDEGVYNWYGNVCNISLKLYDYVLEDGYIGEACSDYIYLVRSFNNTFLDYDVLLKK